MIGGLSLLCTFVTKEAARPSLKSACLSQNHQKLQSLPCGERQVQMWTEKDYIQTGALPECLQTSFTTCSSPPPFTLRELPQPEKLEFENWFILRLGSPSTLIRHENRSFSVTRWLVQCGQKLLMRFQSGNTLKTLFGDYTGVSYFNTLYIPESTLSRAADCAIVLWFW